MENSYTSLAALERAARKFVQPDSSVRPDSASDAKATRPPWFRHIAGIAIVVLAVTNLVTWRALDKERAAHQERRATLGARESVPMPNAWSPSASQWTALRMVAAGVVPGKVTTTAVEAGTSAISDNANMAELSARLAKGLADPKAHDALRGQQKGSALQLYGELLKRWHLSGQEATPVLDALAEHELKQFTGALSGDANLSNMDAADEAAVQAVLTQKQLDELHAFDASLSDRATIAPFLSQLQLEGTLPPADRVDQLVDIMHEERLAVPRPDALSTPQSTTAYAEAMDEWQVALDQRIRDRAALILPSDVLSRLEAYQESQRAANSVFASLGPDTAQPAGTSSGTR